MIIFGVGILIGFGVYDCLVFKICGCVVGGCGVIGVVVFIGG